jgi:hypothetical protein
MACLREWLITTNDFVLADIFLIQAVRIVSNISPGENWQLSVKSASYP